jgi:hypothetical protein
LVVRQPVAADHREADEEADEVGGQVVERLGEVTHVSTRANSTLSRP